MRNTLALLAIVVALPLVGACNGTSDGGGGISSEEADAEYRAQVESYNRQTEMQDRILARQEAEMERMTKHSDRIEKILSKQEEQAKRMDAILDADEKRVGIKP